jgi:hypothetical protein
MNWIETRVRNMINPYSTAFAGWWCHSGRLRLPQMITGSKATTRAEQTARPAMPSASSAGPEAFGLHPTPSMAVRRAAIDAVLASETMKVEGDAGRESRPPAP